MVEERWGRQASGGGLRALVGVAVLAAVTAAPSVPLAGDRPNLPSDRPEQSQIESGEATLDDVRMAGLRMFTTLFNRLDGYGDGPMDPADTTSPGGRPTLQGNGTLLRINGLDGQGCIECHAIVSAATVPPRLGIGGVGGSVTNALIMPTAMDPSDSDDLDGAAGFNGRFANPPFVFGAGGVELLGLEMTRTLQALKSQALAQPGVEVALVAKGVHFGTIVADAFGELDTSRVEGVDPDLVVRPFGRKGEFATVREFDIEAMQFHFGMQPVEAVGAGQDDDGDGVLDEIRVGDLSALSTFIATLDRPRQDPMDDESKRGFGLFREVGCADCHMPFLETEGRHLPLRFPELPTKPFKNVFLSADLTRAPASFRPRPGGGVRVPLFADLKYHDMGPELAETFALADERKNRRFTTGRLWGIADTAPYLHDGRATTLGDAIRMHGGEAQSVREAFVALDEADRDAILAFLGTLRTPDDPVQALLRRMSLGSRDERRSRR